MKGLRVGYFGSWLRADEVARIAHRLAAGLDPQGPDAPWAVAVVATDGTVSAAASTMLSSGIFWGFDGHRPLIGTDPRTVACTLGLVELSEEFIRDYSVRRLDPCRTPYRGVWRVPAGRTAMWKRGQATPQVTSWIANDLAEHPDLSGPSAEALYVDTFDAAVSDLISRMPTPVVVGLSGGLDSTFMVSSVKRAGAEVWAMTHRPLPQAGQNQHDEFDLAALMHPEHHESVMNVARQRPLVAAQLASRQSGVPVFSPENQIWLSEIARRVTDMGASVWWVGGHGNASFSHSHPYAGAHYVRRGRPRAALSVHAGGVRGLVRNWSGRRDYLQWLVRSNSALVAAANPAAGPLRIDPFCARSVLKVAARIEPREWHRGEGSRAFARRVSAGHVPDAIRLRTARGLQSADAWFVIRNDRDAYLQQVRVLDQAPGMGEVDTRSLIEEVRRWPWGEVSGPAWPKLYRVHRLLALADFARSIRHEAGAGAPGTLLMDPARVAVL